MEQPPANTDTQLTEYLFRQLSALENKSLQLGNLPMLTALPSRSGTMISDLYRN
jgi:hypothetical protein